MSEGIKIVRRKGGNVMLHNGHQFYKHKENKNTTIWTCRKKRKEKCSGSVTVNDKMDIVKEHTHTCTPELLQNEIAIAINQVKNEAKTTDRPIPELYDEALNNWEHKGYNLITPLPNFQNAKHSIYDARNKSSGMAKLNFKNFEEVQIPVQHSQNVVADYYDGHTRIIVFCMEQNRAIINDIKEIFGDATFKCTPSPFAELFIIHGDFGSTNTTTYAKPLLYALLSEKSSETYVTLFNLLKSQFPHWEPEKYHCDFELAAMNAIRKVYPSIAVIGCYFHWSQAMWRNGKKMIGKRKSKSAKRLVSLCSALPLLPEEYLESGWDFINSQFNGTQNTKIKKFLRYVDKQWIARDVYKILSVFANRHRTNNVCESWHAKLNKNLNKRKTNILRLLNEIKKLTTYKNNAKIRPRSRIEIEDDDTIREVHLGLILGELTVGVALDRLR